MLGRIWGKYGFPVSRNTGTWGTSCGATHQKQGVLWNPCRLGDTGLVFKTSPFVRSGIPPTVQGKGFPKRRVPAGANLGANTFEMRPRH